MLNLNNLRKKNRGGAFGREPTLMVPVVVYLFFRVHPPTPPDLFACHVATILRINMKMKARVCSQGLRTTEKTTCTYLTHFVSLDRHSTTIPKVVVERGLRIHSFVGIVIIYAIHLIMRGELQYSALAPSLLSVL